MYKYHHYTELKVRSPSQLPPSIPTASKVMTIKDLSCFPSELFLFAFICMHIFNSMIHYFKLIFNKNENI